MVMELVTWCIDGNTFGNRCLGCSDRNMVSLNERTMRTVKAECCLLNEPIWHSLVWAASSQSVFFRRFHQLVPGCSFTPETKRERGRLISLQSHLSGIFIWCDWSISLSRIKSANTGDNSLIIIFHQVSIKKFGEKSHSPETGLLLKVIVSHLWHQLPSVQVGTQTHTVWVAAGASQPFLSDLSCCVGVPPSSVM